MALRIGGEANVWIPPRGLDLEEPISRHFWEWLLSRIWLVRFVGWERLVRDRQLTIDLTLAGDKYLSQYRHLWKLDWGWNGLRSPADRLDWTGWGEWQRRFRTIVGPWLKLCEFRFPLTVEVLRPSDVLWLMCVPQEGVIYAKCAHNTACEAIRHLAPSIRCELTDAVSIGSETLLLTESNRRSIDSELRIATRSFPNAIVLPWNKLWLTRYKPLLRNVRERLDFPKPWARMNSEDREGLSVVAELMDSPEGRRIWSSPARETLWKAEPPRSLKLGETQDLDDPKNHGLIQMRVNRLARSEVDVLGGISEYSAAHKILFSDIYTFAGELKRSDSEGGFGTTRTVSSEYIELELRILDSLWSRAWRRSISPAEKLSAIAAFHPRFQLIHPFNDGNGHIGRLLLAFQIAELGASFNPTRWTFGKEKYRKAIACSLQAGNAEPFRSWLANEIKLDSEACLPFDLRPVTRPRT